MAPDIENQVRSTVHEYRQAGLTILTASDETVATESARFAKVTGIDLPPAYIQICRITDGIGFDGGILHGLGTYYLNEGDESPAYDGVMDVYEAQQYDFGPTELVEFGNHYGTDPFGWHLVERCFVRADPNYRDIFDRYESFEDMFRALFRMV